MWRVLRRGRTRCREGVGGRGIVAREFENDMRKGLKTLRTTFLSRSSTLERSNQRLNE